MEGGRARSHAPHIHNNHRILTTEMSLVQIYHRIKMSSHDHKQRRGCRLLCYQYPQSPAIPEPEITYIHPVPCVSLSSSSLMSMVPVCISTANIYTGNQPPPAPAPAQNPEENTEMCRNKEAGISCCQKRMWLVMAKILTYNSQHCSSFLSYIC